RARAESASAASRPALSYAYEFAGHPEPDDSPRSGGRTRPARVDEPHPRPRRAGAAGESRGARGALPPPLRPHLQLPAHERREPPRRGGPDDADLPEDARGDRTFPL